MLGVCLGCGPDSAARKRISPEYDQTTGKLKLLKYDSNSDGKVDKWEVYEGDHLASVAFDTTHRGTPDRKLTYGPHGTARVEVDEKGEGRWTVVPVAAPRD